MPQMSDPKYAYPYPPQGQGKLLFFFFWLCHGSNQSIYIFILSYMLHFGKQLHRDCTHNKFHPLNSGTSLVLFFSHMICWWRIQIKFHLSFFSRFGCVLSLCINFIYFLLCGELLLAGYYQGPPVMAPPQYYAAPPPRRQAGFLEGWLVPFTAHLFLYYLYSFPFFFFHQLCVIDRIPLCSCLSLAALCCCCLIDECCCDPSIIFISWCIASKFNTASGKIK